MREQPITRQVVDAAYAIHYPSLPEPTQDKIRNLIIDGMGVLIEGLGHHNVGIVVDHLRDVGGNSTSFLPGHDYATSITDAAFVHGIAIHVMDFEPMFDPPTHVVSPVLGALVALMMCDGKSSCAKRDPHGELFLNAFTAGIELQADLRTAALIADNDARVHENFFPFQKQGFHPPGTVGVMGAALASSIWLGLTTEQACMALGMAASRAGGIAGNIGTMTKAAHSGNAARAGVECAMLAKRGFTASAATLEEPGGWGDVFGGDFFDRKQLVEGMRSLRCFSAPGFAFKYWPAHTAMQVSIHAALPLHTPGAPFEGSVHIEAPVFKYCDRPQPKSTDECRFSIQFNVVQAIVDGKVTPESYSEAQLNRPDIQHLLAKTRLDMVHDIPADFTKMEVRVKLSDGRASVSDRWPGHWKLPATREQIQQKFMHCASYMFPKETAEQLFHCLSASTNQIDILQLTALLRERI
jgi:2-methylcitrate dehydratase PrpD